MSRNATPEEIAEVQRLTEEKKAREAAAQSNGKAEPPWPADDPGPDEPPDDPGPLEPSDDSDTTSWQEIEIGRRLEWLRFDREARRRLDDETRPPTVLPPVKTLTELLAEPDTPTRYRIEGLAPENSRIMLSAQYKAGKTTLVGNLLRSLADGDEFLGKFTVHTPAKHAVLIDTEMSENTLRRWLRDQDISITGAVADVALRGKVSTFNLLDEHCRAQWVQRLRELGCDYLILDCLRPVLDALGLDESHDSGRFLVAFDALLADAAIADAAIVQHMGHANERARDDSRLQDWPDAVWRLVRADDDPASSATSPPTAATSASAKGGWASIWPPADWPTPTAPGWTPRSTRRWWRSSSFSRGALKRAEKR